MESLSACVTRRLGDRSERYIRAVREQAAARIAAAPPRRDLAPTWQFDVQAPLRGSVISLRRTDDRGQVTVLGHPFLVDPQWPYRLVRCEVALQDDLIRFFALRRRQPDHQPLLREVPYTFPRRPRFRG